MRDSSGAVSAVVVSSLALCGPVLASDDAAIGTAGGLHGSVQLAVAGFDAERRPVGREIASGDPIYLGDQIVTGPGGGLQVLLLDQTIVSLGENARMTIDEMRFNPANGDGKISFGVDQGAFRFISGQVAQARPDNVSIRVPMGNIGIRGTIVGGTVGPESALVALLGPGSDNNSAARTGAITVMTPGGTVEISRTGYATLLVPGQPPSPPAPLSPAQIQQLGQASPPPAASPPPSGGAGGGVSASGVSGAGTAAGGGTATVAFSGPALRSVSDPSREMTVGTFQRQVAAWDASLAAVPRLDDSTGTAFDLVPGRGVRILKETSNSTLVDGMTQIDHTFDFITDDYTQLTFTYTRDGVTLANLTPGDDYGVVELDQRRNGGAPRVTQYSDVGQRTDLYDYHAVPGLLYATYGYWKESYSDSSRVDTGVFGTGVPTPQAQMPRSGTATYAGAAVGFVTTDRWSSQTRFTGTASLAADFGGGTIRGALTGLTAQDVTLGSVALASAPIHGSTFGTGVATGTINGTAATGQYGGGFYGPAAREVAGTVSLTGNGVNLVGSFGAKK